MRLGAWCVAAVALASAGAWALAGEEEWKPQGEGWVQLFNGKDLAGWKFRGGTNKFWKVEDSVMANDMAKGQHGCDIFTEQTFRDFQLHIEFKIAKGGNSGVYLRGRTEIQIDDAFGRPVSKVNCGAIYNNIAPLVNACKAAGEWNVFDAKVVGDKYTVLLNGQKIHDDVEFAGLTGGAMDNQAAKPGPLMLQGDHTAVSYRNIWIKPLPPPEEKK